MCCHNKQGPWVQTHPLPGRFHSIAQLHFILTCRSIQSFRYMYTVQSCSGGFQTRQVLSPSYATHRLFTSCTHTHIHIYIYATHRLFTSCTHTHTHTHIYIYIYVENGCHFANVTFKFTFVIVKVWNPFTMPLKAVHKGLIVNEFAVFRLTGWHGSRRLHINRTI